MQKIAFAVRGSAHTQRKAFLTEVPKWDRTLATGLRRNSCPPAASQVQPQVGRCDTLYSAIQAQIIFLHVDPFVLARSNPHRRPDSFSVRRAQCAYMRADDRGKSDT